MTAGWVALVESNTTGTGRIFPQRVRELGLRPLMVCADPGRYNYIEADGLDTVVADTTSAAAVAGAVRERIGLACKGITTSSERAVGVTAGAAALLGLPGENAESVGRCRDKAEQRRIMAAAGLRTPAFRSCASAGEAVSAAADIGLPVVVKPVAGTGSAGVRSCTTAGEVRGWAERLLEQAPDPSVLVEEQLHGPEFSVETVGGQVLGVTATSLCAEPYFVETGHDFPASLPAEVADRISDEALRALAALDVGKVAAHTEIRCGASGPVVVEVNPRLAGGMIPQLIRFATGVDPILAVLELITGGTPALTPRLRRHSAIRFVIPERSGRIRRVSGAAAVRRSPGVVDVAVAPLAGTVFQHRYSFQDRIGHVITTGSSPATAAARAEAALRKLQVQLQPIDEKGSMS